MVSYNCALDMTLPLSDRSPLSSPHRARSPVARDLSARCIYSIHRNDMSGEPTAQVGRKRPSDVPASDHLGWRIPAQALREREDWERDCLTLD